MKDDIRKKTVIIIRKNNYYMIGRSKLSGRIEWSPYQYDAWRTREKELAQDIANETGGIMVLFNPIVNQLKVI